MQTDTTINSDVQSTENFNIFLDSIIYPISPNFLDYTSMIIYPTQLCYLASTTFLLQLIIRIQIP